MGRLHRIDISAFRRTCSYSWLVPVLITNLITMAALASPGDETSISNLHRIEIDPAIHQTIDRNESPNLLVFLHQRADLSAAGTINGDGGEQLVSLDFDSQDLSDPGYYQALIRILGNDPISAREIPVILILNDPNRIFRDRFEPAPHQFNAR